MPSDRELDKVNENGTSPVPGAVNGTARPVGHGEQQQPDAGNQNAGPMASCNLGMLCSIEVTAIIVQPQGGLISGRVLIETFHLFEFS